MDGNNTLFSFERNTYGEFFLKLIQELQDEVPGFDMSCLVRYYNDTNTKFEYGIKITRGNKNTACVMFKEDFEKGLIINNSSIFVTEIGNFTDSEDKGVWQAAFGHDDAVMSQIQLEFVKKTLQYILFKQDFDATKPESEEKHQSNSYADQYFNIFDQYRSVEELYKETQNENESRLNRFS